MIAIAAAVVLLAVLGLFLVVLPPMLLPGGPLGPPFSGPGSSFIPSPSPPQPSPAASTTSFNDVAKAASDARGNLVAALGVLAVVAGAVVGLLNFRESHLQNLRSLDLSRQQQANERFIKTIEQLGKSGTGDIDVRIGAIYSLEQIARDSPEKFHGPVMETLTAFLRGHSRPSGRESMPGRGVRGRRGIATYLARRVSSWRASLHYQGAVSPIDVEAHDVNLTPPADFQAITTVLNRREEQRDAQPLDLTGAALPGAMLPKARLEKAILRDAHLEKADLTGAHLEGAQLRGAHLDGAHLEGAHLEGAVLDDAILRCAKLNGAYLGELTVSRETYPWEIVERTPTSLKSAKMRGAVLQGADLEGADLGKAEELTLEQLQSTVSLDRTRLPADLVVRLAKAGGAPSRSPVGLGPVPDSGLTSDK